MTKNNHISVTFELNYDATALFHEYKINNEVQT